GSWGRRSRARASAIENVDADAQRFFAAGASALTSTASTASDSWGRSADGGGNGSDIWRCTTWSAGPDPNGGRPVSMQYTVAARPYTSVVGASACSRNDSGAANPGVP